jgi:paraquat-inducible protein A
LSSRHPEQTQKIHWGFAVTVVTFVLGVFSPLMTVSKRVTKFWIELVNEQNTVSLASGLRDLVHEGHWGMFLLLFSFSIVFPVTKLILCLLMWAVPLSTSMRKLISQILYHAGKWSMLDVFVVGVLVVAVKLGDMVEVKLHAGVFWFAASVCFSIWLKSAISKIEAQTDGPH